MFKHWNPRPDILCVCYNKVDFSKMSTFLYCISWVIKENSAFVFYYISSKNKQKLFLQLYPWYVSNSLQILTCKACPTTSEYILVTIHIPMILLKAPPAYHEVVNSSKQHNFNHLDGKRHSQHTTQSLQTPEGVHFLGLDGGMCGQNNKPQVFLTWHRNICFYYYYYK